MKLNRELQLRILQALAAQYPEAQRNVLREIGEETESGMANLFYLAEHHLVTAKFITQHGTDMGLNGSQRITAAGLDCLIRVCVQAQLYLAVVQVVGVGVHGDFLMRLGTECLGVGRGL